MTISVGENGSISTVYNVGKIDKDTLPNGKIKTIYSGSKANSISFDSPDHKKHKLFKKGGFENYRGKVRIDNVIFNSIVRVGVAPFGEVFYDINLEVAEYLPHTNQNSASDMKMATSYNNSIPQKSDLSTDLAKKDLGETKYDLAEEPSSAAKRDSEYLSAVERGDMETARLQ